MQFSRYEKIWPGGSVGQSAALSRRRSWVRVPSGSFSSIRDLSSAGRASALQAEGHRFEPYRSHFTQYADVAQLAEQLICNQQVIGSSPIIGFLMKIRRAFFQNDCIFYGGIPEWPKGTDCKSAGFAFGGSNPPSPIFCIYDIYIARGRAAWKLVGLITRRSQVQILSPQSMPWQLSWQSRGLKILVSLVRFRSKAFYKI